MRSSWAREIWSKIYCYLDIYLPCYNNPKEVYFVLVFAFLCQSVETKQCREQPHKRRGAISEEHSGTTTAASQIITVSNQN